MIKLICVGKLKENYLKDMVSDYEKRIKRYHKLEIVEVSDSSIEEESSKILHNIKQDEYVIILDIKGNKLTSEEFSVKINDLFINGKSNITFIIGSSLGISEEIKRISDFKLSFGDITMPHGLFRAVFLEQLYRAFKILNNETYHK